MLGKSSVIVCFVCAVLACAPLAGAVAVPQDSSASSNETTMEGTVVASTHQTLTVRTPENQFQLFVFNRYTSKPASVALGSRVSVVSVPSGDSGSRLATRIEVLEKPATQQSSARDAAPIPESVRDVEHNIQREARRWRLGVRAGAALDPELLMFGVHSQMGPIFNQNVFFRPSAEFAFGEVTDLIALNFEGIYRMRTTMHGGKWSPYVGGGPALTFIHQNFQGGRDIDFGNFDFAAGLNILAGMQSRGGTFFEIKTSLWSRPAPVLRLIVGYNF